MKECSFVLFAFLQTKKVEEPSSKNEQAQLLEKPTYLSTLSSKV